MESGGHLDAPAPADRAASQTMVAAEELFVLAADAGWNNAVVVVSPVDFRWHLLAPTYRAPTDWTNDLYVSLRAELMGMPLPPTARAARQEP
jgi:hypothetical protein